MRRGGDPSADKAAVRAAPTVKELCIKFMEDYSSQRHKPSTRRGYLSVIDRCIVPLLGRVKVQDVKRPDVATMMKKLAHKPAEANRAFSVMRKMFNLAEVWGYRPDGSTPCRHVPMYPNGRVTHLISDGDMVRIFRQLDKVESEGLENYVVPLVTSLAGAAGCYAQFGASQYRMVGLSAEVALEQERMATCRQAAKEPNAQAKRPKG